MIIFLELRNLTYQIDQFFVYCSNLIFIALFFINKTISFSIIKDRPYPILFNIENNVIIITLNFELIKKHNNIIRLYDIIGFILSEIVCLYIKT